MDADTLLVELEAALVTQQVLSGSDAAVDAAIGAVMSVLEPVVRSATIALASQAAAEVQAQLPGKRVEVVMAGTDPTIVVAEQAEAASSWSDLEARLTLRLPDDLKHTIEGAARDAGESLNSHVVKLLGKHNPKSSGGRMSGTFET